MWNFDMLGQYMHCLKSITYWQALDLTQQGCWRIVSLSWDQIIKLIAGYFGYIDSCRNWLKFAYLKYSGLQDVSGALHNNHIIFSCQL